MEQPDLPAAPFGDLVKTYRKRARLTQRQLAARLDVHYNTVWAWEQGEHLPDTRGMVLELAKQVRANARETQQLLEASLLAVDPAEAASSDLQAAQRVVRDPLLPPPPAQTTGLIGRDVLLAALKVRLVAGELLVLSALQGLPGVGKTALALVLAHDEEVRAHFADGVLWAGLGQTPRILETLARWGALLGLSPEHAARLATTQAWGEALRIDMGERRFLLVLDDAWQVEDVLACQVGGLGCATLVTTRRPDLALQLGWRDALAVPELAEADGLTLLARLAPQVVEAEPEAARALVQAVGGLPLGLVLLGKHLQLHSALGQPRRIQAALNRLQQGNERLRVATPQVPAMPHPSLPAETPLSLAASIGLSVTNLDAAAQTMLGTLAVFPPKPTSFPEEAALRVADGRPETLDALVDAGLVESLGQGRYALHQTIVDYASQYRHLASAKERFVIWTVDFVEAHHQDAQALEQELPLLLAAFRLAAERGFQTLLVRGVTCLAPRLAEWGLYAIAEPLLLEALRAAQATGDVPGQLRLVYQLAQLAQKRGDYARAEALAEEGIQLAREKQANDHLSALLQVYGIVAKKRGAREEAEQAFNEALILAQEEGDEERIAALLTSLASLHFRYGQYVKAEAAYQAALGPARARGDRAQIVSILSGLAGVADHQGSYLQAHAWLHEALAMAQSLGARQQVVSLLNNLGALELDQGHLEAAEHAMAEGLMLAREMGYQDRITFLLEGLGEVMVRGARYQEAYAVYQEGLMLAQTLGQKERTGSVLLRLADIALLEGEVQQAERWLQEGLGVAQELQQPLLLSQAMLGWGDLERQREHWEAASVAYRTVASSDPQFHRPEYLALADYGQARVTAAQGKWREAQQYGQASLARLEAIGSYQAAEVRQWLASLPVSVVRRDTKKEQQ